MKRFLLTLIMFCLVTPALFGQDEAVIPWVTNTSIFKGQITVNNLNAQDNEVFLVATRNNGDEEAAVRTIPAFGQLVESTATLFPTLGEGPGYRVIVTGSAPVHVGFVISSTGSPSGDSPAQADAVTIDDASATGLLFNYLRITPESGASAPVVVNMGDAEATVTFHAWQDGAMVASSVPVTLGSGRPFADTSANLFPDVVGDIYVIAESDQPLVGLAFIFNASLEPSMANARAIQAVPAQ